MTKTTATPNDTTNATETVGAQGIALEVRSVEGNSLIETREYQLHEIAEVIDCEHKTAPKVDFSEYYSIRTTDILNAKIDFDRANRVSKETYIEWTVRAIPKAGDIILAREAPVGEVGWIKEGYKVCLGQRTVLIKITNNAVNSRFLLYYLANPDTKYDLQSRSSGSVVAHLNMKDIRAFKVKIPYLEEQKAIAAVLSSLDDKIDLLHRQNQTLEAMAQTLFRQWFIEEAREDWTEVSLLDLVDLVGGGTPKTSEPTYWDGDIPWLSGGDIAANHKGFVNTTQKSITYEGLNNSSTKLLPKFSTVISARGTVGKYCLLSKEMAFSQSNYGILPKVENCYFFTNLLIGYAVDELQSAAYGSVFDTITTSTFKEAVFLIPPCEKILQFEEMISYQFVKQLSNQKQIQTLTQLRDTLLPKLMSGEVRVETGVGAISEA